MVTTRRLLSHLRMSAMHPEARRAILFLVVGGTCALFNLAVFSAFTLLVGWGYLPAVLVATEASVFAGFLLNDRITFRALALRAGGWLQRCVRYHLAAAAGQLLTILLGLGLIHVVGFEPILAQASALAVATVFNFLVQRFVTYAARSHLHQGGASIAVSNTDLAAVPSTPAVPGIAQPVSMFVWARLHPPPTDD